MNIENEILVIVSIGSGIITILAGIFAVVSSKKKAIAESIKQQTQLENDVKLLSDKYLSLYKDVEITKAEINKLSSLQIDVALIKRDIDQLRDSYVTMTRQIQIIDNKINKLLDKILNKNDE